MNITARTDRNHNYHSDIKRKHRAFVYRIHRALTGSNVGSCVTLVSCEDDAVTHASCDILQWSKHFGDSFIGVNYEDISDAFYKHHPRCAFVRESGYKAFARLMVINPGLYYLDTTQCMRTLLSKTQKGRHARKYLNKCFESDQSGSTLALNMCFNKYTQASKASKRQIRKRIADVTAVLNLGDWQLLPVFDAYQSTAKTLMVTMFFHLTR